MLGAKDPGHARSRRPKRCTWPRRFVRWPRHDQPDGIPRQTCALWPEIQHGPQPSQAKKCGSPLHVAFWLRPKTHTLVLFKNKKLPPSQMCVGVNHSSSSHNRAHSYAKRHTRRPGCAKFEIHPTRGFYQVTKRNKGVAIRGPQNGPPLFHWVQSLSQRLSP